MKRKIRQIISVLLCLTMAISSAACGAGSTEESISAVPVTEKNALSDDGWQAHVTFPDWKGYTDDTLAMNSMYSFFGYHGQGTIYVRTSKKTKSFRMYVNEHIVDTSEINPGSIASIDISSIAVDGENTIQVSGISPSKLTGAVDVYIPYPEVLEGTPEEEGISPQALSLISDLIDTDIENGFPSAQLSVIRNGRLVYENAWGRTNAYLPDGSPCTDSPEVTTDTLYDIASLTKMFSVNYAIQKLLTDGEIDLDTKITDYLGDEFVKSTILIPEEEQTDTAGTAATEAAAAEAAASSTEAEVSSGKAEDEAAAAEAATSEAVAAEKTETEEGDSAGSAEKTEQTKEKSDEDSEELKQVKAWKAELTIRDLLRHQGGFPADPRYCAPVLYKKDLKEGETYPENPLFGGNAADEETRQNTIRMICKTPLEYEPGTKTVYSDVDYMVLGLIVEQITGRDLDTYMKDTFYKPMGLSRITFNPLRNGFTADDCAATELNGNTRDGLLDYEGYRTGTIQGEVHDEKAYYSMGGISGHAGLFSNATDLAKLASVMLSGGYGQNSFFSDNVIDMFTAPKKEDAANWGLGWWRQGDEQRVWYFGTQAESGTFGHQGWTGVLAMIDPERNLVIVYLTNLRNTRVTDKLDDENRFDGNWYTAGTLGFVPQILSIGMDSSEDISGQLLDLTEDMAAESLKLIPKKISPDGDHPAARNARSKQQLYEKWAEALKKINKE